MTTRVVDLELVTDRSTDVSFGVSIILYPWEEILTTAGPTTEQISLKLNITWRNFWTTGIS